MKKQTPVATKRCARCHADLPLTNYRVAPKRPTFRVRYCLSCEELPQPNSIIYALTDPRTHTIRYIGVTQDLQKRTGHHLRFNQTKTAGPLVRAWIEALVSEGLTPGLVKLDEVAAKDRTYKESQWIYFGRSVGWELLNISGGTLSEAAS